MRILEVYLGGDIVEATYTSAVHLDFVVPTGTSTWPDGV